MRRILIADTSVAICDALKKVLSMEFSVMCCQDGQAALELLGSFAPDLLVLDLSVPLVNGLEVLRIARLCGYPMQMLVTTPNDSCYVLTRLRQLQVDQVCRRPCRTDSLLCSIRQLALQSQMESWCPEIEADHILLQLGFRMGYGMYNNTFAAIMMKYRGNIGALMKDMYPAIAADFRGNALQVEKSIRDAIHRAHKNGNMAVWKLYFGDGVEKQCPTNELFITRIARALQAHEQVQKPTEIKAELMKNA